MQIKLKVLAGKSEGKEIPITKKRFMIGRAEQCNLRPKSDSISRNHCTILVKEQGVLIRDLNSRNGTFINGEKVSGDVELESGDHLQLGKLEFQILIKQSKKATAPKKAKPAEKGSDDSLDFDISEWLDDDALSKSQEAEPETRQFKLDETDRIALEKAKEESAEEEEARPRRFARPQKEPGKLPERAEESAATSRDAAADMLKKFFNNR